MTLEELKRINREEILADIVHRREYNGIRVFICGKGTIEIKPIDSDVWYEYNTDDIENQVAAARTGDFLMGIPKSVWEKWLAEPFFKD